ncbi:Nucleoside ABC transporter, permease protein 2 [hydrothermal vent metagenome]|uniref:Nucleoside ABC transporter, permease protein 2 n=1 Tax=hydrothermal vent metagenome TaxID=652676 RepID=A0A3B0SDH2_9ZZZZ
MTTDTREPMVEMKNGSVNWSRWARIIAIFVVAMIALSAIQELSGTTQLTSSGTWGAALRLTVPILLAGLGGLYSERAGIVNIGLEGMMIAGTWFGAWAGWMYGPWWGVAFGVAGGLFFGLIHAIATVTFGVDQIISGVAINLLAAGAMRFLSVVTFTIGTGGGATQSPRIQGFIPTFNVPLLSPFLESVEEKGWFFFSDIAGILGGFTTTVSWLTVIGLLAVPISAWLLWKTAWGLRLRSVGENPWAAESLGVPVLRMKYWGVLISGALSGLGGAYLVLVQAGIYREGQTGGRGFIGLGALIFGNWIPAGVLAGAGLFGYADALRLRQASAVHALLLLIAVGLAAFALWKVWKKSYGAAASMAVFAVLFFLWWVTTDEVATEIVTATPYIATLLVLSLASQRLRMPAADGIPYRKGEAH